MGNMIDVQEGGKQETNYVKLGITEVYAIHAILKI